MNKILNYKDAYRYSLRLLSGKDYSKFKLREKLFSKEISLEIIEKLIEELIEKKYLNEDNYIRSKAISLIKKNISKQMIQKKFSYEQISISEEQIDFFFTEENLSDQKMIKNLLVKKLRNSLPLSKNLEPGRYNSLIKHALTKGHDLYLVKKELGQLLNQDSLDATS